MLRRPLTEIEVKGEDIEEMEKAILAHELSVKKEEILTNNAPAAPEGPLADASTVVPTDSTPTAPETPSH